MNKVGEATPEMFHLFALTHCVNKPALRAIQRYHWNRNIIDQPREIRIEVQLIA